MNWQKQRLIIFAVVYLSAVFFTVKNIPVAYGQSTVRGSIYYHQWGYFKADNGKLGGPGCGVCVEHYEYNRSGCRIKRPGIQGYFTKDSACKAAYGSGVTAGSNLGGTYSVNICGFNSSRFQKFECITPYSAPCVGLNNGICQKISTSILQGTNNPQGDVSTEPSQFILRVFTIILGVAGGISLLLIIAAGYKFITSKGKPEEIQQGKEQLTSAIVGLIFIIFSFIIFQLIFVDILKIPGITK